MKRTIKILSIAFAVIITVLIVVLLTVDINQYKDDIVRVVETNTGRKFSIEGDVYLGVSLLPTVVIEKASLGNAAWGSRETMLDIERLEVSVAILPLLTGDISVSRFHLVRPDIYLETDKQGRGNWLLPAGEKKASAGTESPVNETSPDGFTPPQLDFRRVLIEEAMIAYHDGQTGDRHELSIEKMAFRADGRDAPMHVEIAAGFRDMSLQFTGTTGSLNGLLSNSAFPVVLDAGFAGVRLHVDGTFERPLEVDGVTLELALEAESLDDLPGDDWPDVAPVSVTTSLAGRDGMYEANPLSIRIGESNINGKIGFDMSRPRSVISAELRSGLIDLTPFESDEEEEETARSERLFSADPLPVETFRSMDVAVTLAVEGIRSSRLPMSKVDVGIMLQNGVLRVAPVTADIAGGKLTANAGLSVTGKDSMKLDFVLRIDGLQPAMLPQVKKKDSLSGAITNVSIRAEGAGNSVRAIMAGLDGGLLVKTGEGKIRNLKFELAGADLVTKTYSMLKPSEDKEQVTELQCAVVNFSIEDGMAVADRGIAMETPRMTVVGGGAVNLKTEEIDLGMRPHPREGIGLGAGQFAELVRLRGTLANPQVKPDTLAALKTAATVGAAVATGGLSLLAGGLVDKATADPHPCMTALGEKPVVTDKAKPASTENTSEKKNVGEKVKGMFKGLFGD